MQAEWYPERDYGLAWEICDRPLGVLGFLPIGTFGTAALGTHEWIIPKRNMITIFMTACEGTAQASEHAFQRWWRPACNNNDADSANARTKS